MSNITENDSNKAKGTDLSFRRIVVALDPSAESLALLDFAADLAVELDISLTGVFVEDTSIGDYAEMPFAREICLSGASVQDLSRGRIQSYYRREAQRARRALEAVGHARRVEYRFELRQGDLESELAAVVQERDLLAVFQGMGTVVRPREHDIMGRLGASAASGFLAFSRRIGVVADSRILAFYTGSPEAERAVVLAARMATRRKSPLVVIVAGDLDASDAEDAVRTLADGVQALSVIINGGRQAGLLETMLPSLELLILPADLGEEWQAAVRPLKVPRLLIRKPPMG